MSYKHNVQGNVKDMRPTLLVQRLRAPFGHKAGPLAGKDNPFSFGGGLRNGGLKPEAMDLLRDIFSFDYMGRAEFEFGAVPKALSAIAQNADKYVTTTITIPLADVKKHWKDKTRKPPTGTAEVYVICHRDHTKAVEAFIRADAKDGFETDLCEPTLLDNALRPMEDWDTNRCGWLELDNGFFFFTDREMFEGVAKLFGVEV